MGLKTRDVLTLKAAIEFGSDCDYTIKNGGLGPTLVIDARIKEKAQEMRKKIPVEWEGLYTIVIYSKADVDDDEEWLYDPSLT